MTSATSNPEVAKKPLALTAGIPALYSESFDVVALSGDGRIGVVAAPNPARTRSCVLVYGIT